ncbi:MAG TPA: hypothetical protein VFQ72_03990 [Candidatus Paceibacterota bacterium]|nr:hypothetical protein [Candidatus Paceibacterota bacterium]
MSFIRELIQEIEHFKGPLRAAKEGARALDELEENQRRFDEQRKQIASVRTDVERAEIIKRMIALGKRCQELRDVADAAPQKVAASLSPFL